MWRIVLFFSGILIAGCGTTQSQMDKTATHESIFDTVWQWERTVATNDNCIVPTPERYTLRFTKDSKVQAQFDCNRGGGSFVISEEKLSFGPLISTRRACEPNSLDGRYMKDLQQVVAFFVQNDILYLELSGDSGTMHFRRAVEQVHEK